MNSTFIFKIIACSLLAHTLFASDSKVHLQMTPDSAITAYMNQENSSQDESYTPAELELYRNTMKVASILRTILREHYQNFPVNDLAPGVTEVLYAEPGSERVHYAVQKLSEPITIVAAAPSNIKSSVSIKSLSMPAISFVPSHQLPTARSSAASPSPSRSSNSPRSISALPTLAHYGRAQSTNLSASGLFLGCKEGHPCSIINPWNCYEFWNPTDCRGDKSLKEKLMRDVKKKLILGEQLMGEETYPILKVGRTTLPKPVVAPSFRMQTRKSAAQWQAMQEHVATHKPPSLLARICCCKCNRERN